MFDIGGPELLVILLGIIVLFGPKKIPEVAQMIGKGIQKVRTAQTQFKEQIDEIQTELSVVNKNVFESTPDMQIKEISANDLNKEHFSENTITQDPPALDSNNEMEIPNSVEHGFSPVQPKEQISEPYNLDLPEKDNETEANSHLNGSSHELQG
ncbi:MAG: twin-arginine translocase TatA/TatE family subunit [bacterium]